MTSRRQFHQHLAYLATGCLATSRFVGGSHAAEPRSKGNRLITIFLSGGNDGLNTVIPANDPLYRKYRNDLRIEAADAIPIHGGMFLHPSLRDLSGVWEAGRLRIQQGVGYPNHSRSHFVSSAAWFEGRPTATHPTYDGWLARALDPLQQETQNALAYGIETLDTPALLRGRITRTSSLPAMGAAQARELAKLLQMQRSDSRTTEASRFVAQVCRDASLALERGIRRTSRLDGFPNTTFGRKMKQVAQVVELLPEVKAIHATQDEYDTHSSQRALHGGLLRELAGGLEALDAFLLRSGLSESTLIMVFSEFGRRVKENKSAGTDHGAAGPVFLIGGAAPGGLLGQTPDLENLDQGDVAVTDDFRDLYAAITPWLTAPQPQALSLPGGPS